MGLHNKVLSIKELLSESKNKIDELQDVSSSLRELMSDMLYNKTPEEIDIKIYKRLKEIDNKLRSAI